MDELSAKQLQLEEKLADLETRLSAAKDANDDNAVSKITQEKQQLLRGRFSLYDVDWRYLLLAGLFYLLGMCPSWWYWHQAMQAMGQAPAKRDSFRAFFIGHLGKYVPGKALVVILRMRLVQGPKVEGPVAAICVFIETLTLMAVGSLIAAAILAFYSQHWLMTLLAVGLMLAAGLPTLPPIFRRLVRIAQVRRFTPHVDELLQGVNTSLMLRGWILISLGWFCLGLSMWATLLSVPGVESITLSQFPLLLACVVLAMVAGFLSLLPGGVGVRDLVLTTLLAPEFSSVVALSAAILLRLVWLLTELLISFILYTAFAGPQDTVRQQE